MAEPGALIGPYRLLARLGKGAMGDVWRARDERLDRYVALKLLPPDVADDPERRARMLREARAAAGVGHANVVTLYDVVTHDGTDVLVMELVDGATLSETLRAQGPPTPRQAIDWLIEIADALAAAHGKGILHRDVKSANVMITRDRRVKVLDFGLAKLRDDAPPGAAAALAPGDAAASDAAGAGAGEGALAAGSTPAARTVPDLATRSTAPRAAETPAATSSADAAPAPAPTASAPRAARTDAIALDATMASEPGAAPRPAEAAAAAAPAAVAAAAPRAAADSALDATMPSQPAGASSSPRSLASDQYQTRAGALLGTPMYMAPEQIAGAAPDARSEVFSVGVIAYELCAGKPPYAARTMDELFAQITHEPPPPLPDRVPGPLAAVVARALSKDPAARYPSMTALAAALAKVRDDLYTPAKWPWVVAALALAAAAAATALWLGRARPVPDRPGDAYVRQALHEYDVFYGDKALSSLRAALRVAPEHPRANAYLILFGGGSDAEREAAATVAEHVVANASGKDRALLDTAIALERRGPRAARDAIEAAEGPRDRELAFWAAELAFRAGDFEAASREYTALLDTPAREFRGRIYDHDSAVLLYLDDPDRALAIGKLYKDAFPGEADAIGVYATTLAAAGRLDEAVAAAEDAKNLAEGEDTLAGLGKVYALKGDLARATELYAQSMQKAGDARRPIRRAALALLQWMQGDPAAAAATVAPCLPGGADAKIRERGACLFVAGVVDPAQGEAAAAALDALAAEATDLHPAYGQPAALAALVRARAKFFGGACVIAAPPPAAPPDDATARALRDAYAAPRDFYLTYHLPFFLTWAACEEAALDAARGDPSSAAALLVPHTRAPGRWWLMDDLARYRGP